MNWQDQMEQVFKSYIGRVVAFILAPLLAVAVPPTTNAINEVLGLGLTDQQISNVAIATIAGLALVIFQWLRNRGEWEKNLLELQKLYEAGKELMDSQDQGGDPNPPTVPPGLKP